MPALLSRTTYPSLTEAVYLNQASLGLVGEPAVRAMHEFIDKIARHGNLLMSDDDEVQFFESLRVQGAALFHCPVDQLAVLGSASELLGQLPYLIRPSRGAEVVLVSSDFPAVTRPWLQYAQHAQCDVRFVEDAPDGSLTDAIVASLTPNTAVVAVSLVQFSTGTRLQVDRVRQACCAVGAKLVLDVTQAAGAVSVNWKQCGSDVLVASGYKWLGGHGGVALAVLSPELLAQTPVLPGWMGAPSPFVFDATRVDYAPDARRFTQSTMSYASLVGLTAALEALQHIGLEQVEAHARELGLSLMAASEQIGWLPFRPSNHVETAPHLLTLQHPTLNADRACHALRDARVVCGVRNGRLRVSLAPYNDETDTGTLVDVLAALKADRLN